MSWTFFWTIVVQVVISVGVLFIVSALIVAILKGIRGR